MDAAHTAEQLHALKKEGGSTANDLGSAGQGARTRAAPESPEYRGKYRDMCKDDWLMRLGDHGRTVIMAVPPTAHAMSGIHHQHDPVDVKSLGEAIHFA